MQFSRGNAERERGVRSLQWCCGKRVELGCSHCCRCGCPPASLAGSSLTKIRSTCTGCGWVSSSSSSAKRVRETSRLETHYPVLICACPGLSSSPLSLSLSLCFHFHYDCGVSCASWMRGVHSTGAIARRTLSVRWRSPWLPYSQIAYFFIIAILRCLPLFRSLHNSPSSRAADSLADTQTKCVVCSRRQRHQRWRSSGRTCLGERENN